MARNALLALVTLLALTGLPPSAASTSQSVDAVRGLLTRLVPTASKSTLDQFTFSTLDESKCKGPSKLCFGYSSSATGVLFEGTTGVELAMALNMYLKQETNSSVSWPQTGGNHIDVPVQIPQPKTSVHVERSTKKHYYANVCTFSYSFVWYTLDDWVREIDWMALSGVNLPLAYTGQEKIYQKVGLRAFLALVSAHPHSLRPHLAKKNTGVQLRGHLQRVTVRVLRRAGLPGVEPGAGPAGVGRPHGLGAPRAARTAVGHRPAAVVHRRAVGAFAPDSAADACLRHDAGAARFPGAGIESLTLPTHTSVLPAP